MSMNIILPEESDSTKALQTRVNRTHNRNPVISYLASLNSKDSRRVQKTALDQIASLLSNGEIEESLNFPWERLDYGIVTTVKAWLDSKYAPSTVNRYLCAVRRVLKEAWRHELITAEAYQRATDVRSVSGQRLPSGRELETDEIKALIQACLQDEGNPSSGIRDAAIISLMYSAGLRRAEVVSANFEDLDIKKSELRIIGKRNKERRAFIAAGAIRAIEKWLEIRGYSPGPLFYAINKSGKIVTQRKISPSLYEKSQGLTAKQIVARLSDQTIYNVIEKRAAQAGLQKKATPHDMRRTFVSDLLDVGVDLSTVSKMAGHEDTNTTKRYDRRSSRVMRDAAEKLHIPYPED